MHSNVMRGQVGGNKFKVWEGIEKMRIFTIAAAIIAIATIYIGRRLTKTDTIKTDSIKITVFGLIAGAAIAFALFYISR